jgi:hypothetical protein
MGHVVLPDKSIVSYWWKWPDLLLRHQLDDHGVGRFRMLLKVLFGFQMNKLLLSNALRQPMYHIPMMISTFETTQCWKKLKKDYQTLKLADNS